MLHNMEAFEATYQKYVSALTYALLLLFLLGVSLACLIRRRKKSLSGVPGPRKYFLGSWLNFWELVRAKDATRIVRNWCAEMPGSMIDLGLGPLGVIVLLSPENIQTIFGSGDINYLHKPKQLTDLTKLVSWYDGIGLSRGDKWKARRKLIVSKLSYGKLLSFLEPMNESSKLLVMELESLFETHDVPQAIEGILLQATFRTICKIIFGIESEEEYNSFQCEHFISSIRRYLEIVTDRFTYPWLAVDCLFRLHRSSKDLDNVFQNSMAFIKRLVEDHQETSRSGKKVRKPSFMSDLVTSGLSLEGIYEEISTAVAAGYETTGKALNYLLLMLALNPVHQERCRQEVDLVIQTECAPDSDEEEFSAKSLKEMPYLEQCIMETLRMFPPIPLFMRELEAPVTLDDNVTLAPGAITVVLPIVVHMNPRIYPNPERFEPERFSPEGRAGRSSFAYLPFSVGPRGCLGTKYAMNEMLIMAARILRTFEIFTEEKLENIGFLTRMSITSESPIRFSFKKRVVV